jgi:hypothetical protein
MRSEVEQGQAAGSELTYEPALDEGRRVAEPGAGYEAGGAVMSSGGAGAVVPGQLVDTRIPGKNGGTLRPVRDEAAARALVRKRWDGVSAAARRGLAKAGKQIPDISGQGPVRVVEYLVEQHTLNAADPSARGATQSFKQVMDLAYPKPEREVATGPATPPGGASLALSPELARELLAAMRARREQGE